MLVSRHMRNQTSRAFYTHSESNVPACVTDQHMLIDYQVNQLRYHTSGHALSVFLSDIQPVLLQCNRQIAVGFNNLGQGTRMALEARQQVCKLHITLLVDSHNGDEYGDCVLRGAEDRDIDK